VDVKDPRYQLVVSAVSDFFKCDEERAGSMIETAVEDRVNSESHGSEQARKEIVGGIEQQGPAYIK
tara:strand:+ start:982 stop:1179 length:198 start_codon:yes stop_codon:yes gene_type:complete